MIWLQYITWIRSLISFVPKHLVWQQPRKVRKTERGSDLPLLICGGECLEWSEGSERRSGDRDRLLLFLSWDRLEWSEATEWMSEISNTKIEWFHTITGVCYSIPSKVSLLGYSIFPQNILMESNKNQLRITYKKSVFFCFALSCLKSLKNTNFGIGLSHFFNIYF